MTEQFSALGHNPACETLVAENERLMTALKEVVSLWPRATDMRAVAQEAIDKESPC